MEPAGWYSENIFSVASELADDEEGQQIILDELSKRGLDFSCTPMPTSAEKLDMFKEDTVESAAH